MSLSEVDRLLLQRCLDGAPGAWRNFVDRFLGLAIHVANHNARSRGIEIDQATRDDLVAEIFLELLRNDLAALKRFRRNCSLATYLTVISRRVVVRRLESLSANPGSRVAELAPNHQGPRWSTADNRAIEQIENQEEVERLLVRLDPDEANLVRMYHLEGMTYQEISQTVGIEENSIGPALSRARAKMRNGAKSG